MYNLSKEKEDKNMKFYELFDILALNVEIEIKDGDAIISTSKNLIPYVVYEKYEFRLILSLYIEDNKLVIVLEEK